jgi:uncharacterized protein with von Willebrand factor type A (vWA) domain
LEVAVSTGLPVPLLRALLREDMARGVVERGADGRYRLSRTASERFGRALEQFRPYTDEDD